MRATINRVGKYELKAVLARTALSTVYDGWDSDIARRVAIKTMPLSTADDDEAREALGRFKRGAQAAGQLNHPNIVAVYDYGETTDFAYLVMEFIDGPTLKDLFDKNQRFSIAEIGNVVGGILEALQYSHDRKVVHRDMKPANVMFTQNNVVKITDFGIARLEDSEMTQAGMVIGTPAYMSPEQFLGEKIDWRTDIYSTGVLLYHILTGERPYEGTLATIMHKVLYGAPLLPSRLSTAVTSALDKVVTRAMARKREDRFESCSEFRAELLKALAASASKNERINAAPMETARTTGRPAAGNVPKVLSAAALTGASRRILFASLAGLMIAAGGATAWHLHSRPVSLPVSDRTKEVDARSAPVADPPDGQSTVGTADQFQATNNLNGNNSFGPSIDSRDTVGPEPRQPPVPPEPRDTATGYQDDGGKQQAPPRYDTRPEPPRYTSPTEPPGGSVAVSPPQIRNPPEKKPVATSPAPKATGSDRNPNTTVPDRRQSPADGKSAKAAQEFASRETATGEDSTAEALRRLKNGLSARPSGPPEPSTSPPLYAVTSISGAVGLVCQTVTPETAGQFGLDSARGMVVTGVANGSAAATAGIRQQDVILKINGNEVRDLNGMSKIVAETPEGRTVPIEIFRKGGQQVVQLQVDKLRH